MKTIIIIFYRYYNKGATKMIAYESAILGVVGIVFLNLFAIINFLHINSLLNILNDKSRILKYVLISVFFVFPLYIILSKIVPKKELLNENNVFSYKNIYGWLLFIYILFSIVLLIISINFRQIN